MSTFPASIDLPPTPQAPRAYPASVAKRPYGWGSATAQLDAALLATAAPSATGSNTSPGGLGLWLTHQLYSHVTLDTTDDGFAIRLVTGTPHLESSGHAPHNA